MEYGEWITVQEAADLSGYHPEYLRLLIREGKLDARKFGSVWAINKKALLSYRTIADKSDDGRHGPRYKTN
ncbi:MAG: helix-turn-helix domain-containing protein [Anaerolineae bacterium]|nr:helix-turn-helix domain-containing protein [Anaerolineae bacterium]MBT7190455.1 helix-turn-helix domain-containing protein [Anaerolineae bacterium]